MSSLDNKRKYYSDIVRKVESKLQSYPCITSICKDENICPRHYYYAKSFLMKYDHKQKGGMKKKEVSIKNKTVKTKTKNTGKQKSKSKTGTKKKTKKNKSIKDKTKKTKIKPVVKKEGKIKVGKKKSKTRKQKTEMKGGNRKNVEELYEDVGKQYNNGEMSLTKACKKVGINTKKYYDICKTLNRPSVAISKIKKNVDINQNGGGDNDNTYNEDIDKLVDIDENDDDENAGKVFNDIIPKLDNISIDNDSKNREKQIGGKNLDIEKVYNKISKYCIKKNMKFDDAIQKLGIAKEDYFKICKSLNKPNMAVHKNNTNRNNDIQLRLAEFSNTYDIDSDDIDGIIKVMQNKYPEEYK